MSNQIQYNYYCAFCSAQVKRFNHRETECKRKGGFESITNNDRLNRDGLTFELECGIQSPTSHKNVKEGNDIDNYESDTKYCVSTHDVINKQKCNICIYACMYDDYYNYVNSYGLWH